jgi:hypothetical protein
MELKVHHIETDESIDGKSHAVIILGDCAMSRDGEGTPDDVAVARLTLRKIKYHENIDLARLLPDTTLTVVIAPTQPQLSDFDESIREDDESGE